LHPIGQLANHGLKDAGTIHAGANMIPTITAKIKLYQHAIQVQEDQIDFPNRE
jgi:hypothetical protein